MSRASGPADLQPAPPRFTRKLRQAAVGTGCDVRLRVAVSGNPEPTLLWYRDGEPLPPTGEAGGGDPGGLWIRDCRTPEKMLRKELLEARRALRSSGDAEGGQRAEKSKKKKEKKIRGSGGGERSVVVEMEEEMDKELVVEEMDEEKVVEEMEVVEEKMDEEEVVMKEIEVLISWLMSCGV
ncbi:hypothetical protein NHX12_014949 [Muraenolepis orangiensis]|uniref:Immunoglobulin I-set domain-containing protein n=1 Tax=Muraenolepis orangiensis TaxID=630683 RepID=A0A9Q0I3E9_9TELE|nr:hypothetical protein NHX12_014949 [Muraenolepis orangiensis]